MLDLVVKVNKSLNNQYFILILTAADKLPEMLPGQFAEVRVDDSPATFLRRPISINFVDYEKNELWLLVQIVGDGTQKLSQLKTGDNVNLIFPLGNTFTIPEDKKSNILLIGGGVGIAPMLFLGSCLNDRGYRCNFLLGGRTALNLLQLDDFSNTETFILQLKMVHMERKVLLRNILS